MHTDVRIMKRTLADYGPSEYPELVNLILLQEVKLIALMSNDVIHDPIPTPESTTEVRGPLEIVGIDQVARFLESIYQKNQARKEDRFAVGHIIPSHLNFLPPELGSKTVQFDDSQSTDFDHAIVALPLQRILIQVVDEAQAVSIDTPEYRAIVAVHNEFWADGKDGGKKVVILDWINTHFDFSKKTSDVIDTICRPESRRPGGKKKRLG